MTGSPSTLSDAYAAHSSSQRRSTEVYLSSEIHKHHPDSQITVVLSVACKLVSFAEFNETPITHNENESHFQSQRVYSCPRKRSGEEGSFFTNYDFIKYSCVWDGINITIYDVACSGDGSMNQKYFLVYPKGEELAKKVDNFIKQATEWTTRLDKEIWVFDNSRWQKNKELYKAVEASSWDQVVLPSETKEVFLQDTNGFFDSEKLYSRFNIPWKRGIIVHGPPGNGKTISLKALIKTLAHREDPIPTLYVKSFFDAHSGSRNSIRSIFQFARQQAPCLLILEDLDSMIEDNIRSYFLNEVDGIAGNDGMLIIGTTNHLDKLDPSIAKRPSRFDRKIPFTDPDHQARAQYARHWKVKLDDAPNLAISDDDCEAVAELTEGFSFAYMQEAFIATLRSTVVKIDTAAAKEGTLFMEHFESNTQVLREHMAAAEEAEARKEEKKREKLEAQQVKRTTRSVQAIPYDGSQKSVTQMLLEQRDAAAGVAGSR